MIKRILSVLLLGTVKTRFAHFSPDYKARLEPEKILEAARTAGR
jgi:hypothetical protein